MIYRCIPILYLLTFTLLSCKKTTQAPAISFYYWKTSFKLSEYENSILKENSVKNLYIRYFDIDLDSAKIAFPLSPIRFQQMPFGYKVVPVIYIKNKVFLEQSIKVEELATNVYKFITQISKHIEQQTDEIQLDCDWNLSSRDKYFAFIKALKIISGKSISATIRLHQIKYFKKTGVPPVDKGILMYYNMSPISPDSIVSIYDRNVAKQYIASLQKYPIDLDIALPIFSWGIQIRSGKVLDILPKINIDSMLLQHNIVYLKPNYYQVAEPFFFNGFYLMKNDVLKLESVNEQQLNQMAADIKANIRKTPKEIIFYDLDQFNLKQHEKTDFQKISHHF